MGDTIFGPKIGGDYLAGGHKFVTTGAAEPAASPQRQTILLMSAVAAGEQPVRLDEERRAIDEVISRSRARDRLEVCTADAVRLGDLQQVLLRHRPVIAQFSGHANSAGIQVLDDRGRPRSVPPRALTDLFRILGGGVRCVVLNACHTDEQAEAIAAHVPCVVGMRRDVLDTTAIEFATGFYRGIANEQTVRTSYDLALNGLDLHRLPGSDVPKLIARQGAAERAIV